MPDYGGTTWQKALADFGDFALDTEDLDRILAEACRIVADTLGTGRAKILEIQDDGAWLFVQAGVGWDPGIVGHLRIAMSEPSSESYAIALGKPVVTRDLRLEDRFDIPDFMKAVGVVAIANVPILLPGRRAYGLLQIDDTRPRDFGEDETQFLRTYASILGPVIDRLLKLGQLRASEERFRLTVGTALDYAIFTTDEHDRISDWLPGAEAVFGWSAAEVRGQPASLVFTPEDRQRGEPEKEIETARTEGVALNVREHVRRDGARVFIEGSVWALRRKDGTVTGFIKIGQDVTERRAAELRLLESEQRYRALVVTGSNLVYRMSPDWRRMVHLDGRGFLADTSEPIEGWADHYILPEDRPAVFAAIRQAIRTGTAFELEHRVRLADGGIGWVLSTAIPIRNAAGQIVEWFGAGTDVTPRHEAEEQRRESETRFRTLIEGVPQLNWRSGDEGEWDWASRQWLDYTGQSQAESHGLGWLDAVHPEDRDAALAAWQSARATDGIDVDYRVRRAADGAWRWHQTRSVPVRAPPTADEPEGRIVEWLGTTTDVDDLKRLQEQQGVLVAELQHRTRNLISVVRVVARRSVPPGPALDEFDGRLAALGRVQGFLAQSGAYTVALWDLVDAELHSVGDGAADRVRLGGPAVELPGEGVQPVALALHELATNAVKYGALAQPAGHLSVKWRVEEAADGPCLRIEWRESGVAMPAEPPGRRGYGSELITRALPYQLKAETRLEFRPDGVWCDINLPPGAFRTTETEA